MRGCLRRSIKCGGSSASRRRRSFGPAGGATAGGSSTTASLPFAAFSSSVATCFWSRFFSVMENFSPACGARKSGAAYFCFDDFQNAATYPFQGGCVDINAVQPLSRHTQIQLLFQPDRKIIGIQFETKPRINEVVINAVDTHLPQP